MSKINAKNEKVKHNYYKYVRGAKGFSDKTLDCIQKSIYRYEEFSNFEDFALFSSDRAEKYRKWLENKPHNNKNGTISLTTVYHYLRHLKNFYIWLSSQPGYKSKITLTDVEYLKLDNKKSKIATAPKREKYPTLEQVRKVLASIEINNEIDLRDRALMAFTLISGARDTAIISLPVDCFEKDELLVTQDPKKGVKTKNNKTIYTYLYPFDQNAMAYFIDWYDYLLEEKLFSNTDPIFPRNKVVQGIDSKAFESNEIEPVFWSNADRVREIFKRRFKEAGIEYFSPHTFRHLAINLATKRSRNAEELRAVSQNFGHEELGTTMATYGKLTPTRVGEVIASMSFEDNTEDVEMKEFEEFKRFKEFQKMQQRSGF